MYMCFYACVYVVCVCGNVFYGGLILYYKVYRYERGWYIEVIVYKRFYIFLDYKCYKEGFFYLVMYI